MSHISGVDKVQGDEAFEVYDDTRRHTFVILMERHVLRYEYKWAHLSFSRNN